MTDLACPATSGSEEFKVCTISFERPVNYLCGAWYVFQPTFRQVWAKHCFRNGAIKMLLSNERPIIALGL